MSDNNRYYFTPTGEQSNQLLTWWEDYVSIYNEVLIAMHEAGVTDTIEIGSRFGTDKVGIASEVRKRTPAAIINRAGMDAGEAIGEGGVVSPLTVNDPVCITLYTSAWRDKGGVCGIVKLKGNLELATRPPARKEYREFTINRSTDGKWSVRFGTHHQIVPEGTRVQGAVGVMANNNHIVTFSTGLVVAPKGYLRKLLRELHDHNVKKPTILSKDHRRCITRVSGQLKGYYKGIAIALCEQAHVIAMSADNVLESSKGSVRNLRLYEAIQEELAGLPTVTIVCVDLPAVMANRTYVEQTQELAGSANAAMQHRTLPIGETCHVPYVNTL